MDKEQPKKEIATLLCEKAQNGICWCDETTYSMCNFNCEYYTEYAENLYNAGYRKVPDGAVIIPAEECEEEMKEINKTLAERDELKVKIECLKVENEKLTETIAALLDLCFNCKKSVKDFAEKVKTAFYTEFDETIRSIISAKIDELLKEYEE